MKRCLSTGLLCGLILALVATSVGAQTPARKKKADTAGPPAKGDESFVRVERDADGTAIALQTAIVRYVIRPEGQRRILVDLIGAVHVGDAAYYKQLNKEFEQYQALLYELVAPEGTRVPKGGGSGGHPVGAMQQGLKDLLELEYQLEKVDYHRDNFVHADMSPERFAQSMKDKGESIWAILFRAMGQGIAQQSQNPGGGSDLQLLMAMFDKNRALKLKRIMAEQFQDLEASMSIFEGPDGSTLISERNKVALEVLKGQIEGGKRRLGIFYGAGHLPDLEKRLLEQFGAKRRQVRWLTAWEMKSDKPQ